MCVYRMINVLLWFGVKLAIRFSQILTIEAPVFKANGYCERYYRDISSFSIYFLKYQNLRRFSDHGPKEGMYHHTSKILIYNTFYSRVSKFLYVSHVCSNLSPLVQEPTALSLSGLHTRGLCSTSLCRGFGSSKKIIIVIIANSKQLVQCKRSKGDKS